MRTIDPRDRHLFELDLQAGTLLHAEVEQHACDVFVQLLREDEVLIQVDSRTEDRDSEHLVYLVPESRVYRLAVESYDYNPPAGSYRAVLRGERAAEGRDRLWAEAESAYAAANTARQQGSRGLDVIAAYERAELLFDQLEMPKRTADASYELALLESGAGETQRAVDHFERCIPRFERAGADFMLARATARLAALISDLGRPVEAAEALERAAAIFARLGDTLNEANTLHNLGRLERRRGLTLRAIEFLERALELRQELSDRLGLIDSRNVLGEAYVKVGELELALDHHHRALELAAGVDSETDRAALQAKTRFFIGSALIAAGDLDAAADSYHLALDESRRAAKGLNPALFQVALGLVEARRGHPEVAHDAYQEALVQYRDRSDSAGEATCLNNLAFLFQRLGEVEQALEHHRAALAIYRRLEDRDGEARSLLGIARAYRSRGDPVAALSSAEAALSRVEQVFESGQAPATRSDLSLPFLTTRQDYYGLVVDLLMQLHESNTGAGYDALALATSEQSRARLLLELVQAEGAVRPVEPALLEQRRRLQDEINAAARIADGSTAASADEPEGDDRELQKHLLDLYRVTHEIHLRSADSKLSARPLGLDEIQTVLGEDTTLLEYRLGEERSFLWRVTSDEIASYPLPSRTEIEHLARRAYRLLVRSDQVTHRVPAESALEQISDVLLAPLGDELDAQRLLIVADGALAYLPFAALGSAGGPLADRVEIVQAPSASVVAALRDRASRASVAAEGAGLMAVLADPVFSADDERLGLGADQGERDARRGGLRRLPYTGLEAQAILGLASRRGEVLSALGFDARRELVLGGGLGRFRILHFATHGTLHADHPELSALMLSRFDASGLPTPGRLPLHEIYGLDLSADLVVLSACRSALGRESRGEGLLGLPRGFLHAGARRVLVSLWRVDDESTAELMTRFYRHLLEEGMAPSAALRAAQNSLRAAPRFEAPYHWAGFVLQGDWL